MLPTRKIKIPEGCEIIQPNQLFETMSEAKEKYGSLLIKTWTDVESGKICCSTIRQLKKKEK